MKIAFGFFFLIFLQLIVSGAETLKDVVLGGIFVVDNNGNIYVNSGEHSISKYSPTGEPLLTIGEKGEGPSNIKRLGSFAVNPVDNNIYVTEYFGGNKWISKFSTDGKYQGEWNVKVDWKKCKAISSIKFDSKGNVYFETKHTVTRPCKDFTVGAIETVLVKYSPQGEKLKEIYTFRSDVYVDKPGKGNLTIPFGNLLDYTILDDYIIIRENGDDFIQVFDLDGNLQKKISLPFKKKKVTQKDIDAWEKELKSSRFGQRGISEGWLDPGYWRNRLPFPEYKPLSAYPLFRDSQGYVYSIKYPGDDDTFHKYARINPSTGDVSIIEGNTEERLVGTWKNYFFVYRQDEIDDYVIVKIDEKEFLEKRNGKK